jgi:hypothetical protein
LEYLSTHVMMAEMEAAGQGAGVKLMKTIEEVIQEPEKQAAQGVGMRILAFAWHAALIIVSYFLSDWLKGRLQPNEGAGWYRGLTDGGPFGLGSFCPKIYNGIQARVLERSHILGIYNIPLVGNLPDIDQCGFLADSDL